MSDLKGAIIGYGLAGASFHAPLISSTPGLAVPGTWGIEPESRWGRLVKAEESEAVPSEPGAWPTFYTELELALRVGGPPPVDAADGVATLEVIDAARPSVAERQQKRVPD